MLLSTNLRELPGQPQGPTPPHYTALAPTILRLRFPTIFVDYDEFDI